MIDLNALAREAASADGDRAVVSRSWLAQVLSELTSCREATRVCGQCFGLPRDKRL